MEFVFKFFKELNSAGNEKMISLAVALGLISGFLPFFNIFNVLIFVIVIIFRIPLGLFLRVGVSSLLPGTLSDALFAQTGYALLSYDCLLGIWGVSA